MPFPMKNMDKELKKLTGPIALLGFGVEGRETFRFLASHGIQDLVVFDREPCLPEIKKAFGEMPWHQEEEWEEFLPLCHTIFRSPGIRPDIPALSAAREKGARITSATEFFLAACPCPVVGITGTVGKGTTTSLIGNALETSGITAYLGGNIGLNPLRYLDSIKPEDVAVLELSSFQLMNLTGRKPDVAVILRTSSEHLDWHTDENEYRKAKSNILAPKNPAQKVVYCLDAPGTLQVLEALSPSQLAKAWTYSLEGPVKKGVGVKENAMFWMEGKPETPLKKLENLSMSGRFNGENAAAAFIVSTVLGADSEIAMTAIAAFPGLPHRLERVGKVGKIECYNDSYATRPEATLGALRAFSTPLAVILGGSEKHADFTDLAQELCGHPSLRKIVLIGATADRLAENIEKAGLGLGMGVPLCQKAETLEDAFYKALDGLEGNGTLLFSPACASFGMFPNYKVRGDSFRELVCRFGGIEREQENTEEGETR